MCQCQEQYCFGCGRTRVLIGSAKMCRECYDDWLRLTPGRLRGEESAPEEIHAR